MIQGWQLSQCVVLSPNRPRVLSGEVDCVDSKVRDNYEAISEIDQWQRL